MWGITNIIIGGLGLFAATTSLSKALASVKESRASMTNSASRSLLFTISSEDQIDSGNPCIKIDLVLIVSSSNGASTLLLAGINTPSGTIHFAPEEPTTTSKLRGSNSSKDST